MTGQQYLSESNYYAHVSRINGYAGPHFNY